MINAFSFYGPQLILISYVNNTLRWIPGQGGKDSQVEARSTMILQRFERTSSSEIGSIIQTLGKYITSLHPISLSFPRIFFLICFERTSSFDRMEALLKSWIYDFRLVFLFFLVFISLYLSCNFSPIHLSHTIFS